MIVFITSVRHPLNSNNFRRVEELLAVSLRSVCSQTVDSFRVIVVCNQLPQCSFSSDNLIYHLVGFPPPSTLPRAATGMNALARDKGSKLFSGMLLARRLNPEYFFIFDADDLVSRHVAEYLEGHPGMPGWYVDAGYVLNYHTGYQQRKHGLVRYCGTTLAPNATQLLRLSGATSNLNEHSSQEELLAGVSPNFIDSIVGNHVHMVPYFGSHGLRMRPIPFRAAAWVLQTGENHTGVAGRVTGVPLTASFRREFNFGNESDVALRPTLGEIVKEAASAFGSRVGSLAAPLRRMRESVKRVAT